MKDGNGKDTAGHSNRVFAMSFSDKNMNVLYTGGWDHTIQVWDMRVGHSVNSIHDVSIFGDSMDVRDQTLMVGNYSPEKQL